jgi:hypothetical protein
LNKARLCRRWIATLSEASRRLAVTRTLDFVETFCLVFIFSSSNTLC